MAAIRVLMFGWEFPPHISGGLGTACYGLTRGLLQQDVDVLFVVPRLFGKEDSGRIRLIDAGKVPIKTPYPEDTAGFTYFEAHSGLRPYASRETTVALKEIEGTGNTVHNPDDFRFAFSAHYGNNLLNEVENYARVARQIARENTFDVIHVHDWLTFPAGIAARTESGKPLIAHVHATEFDRSGENVDPLIYETERQGMEAADRVITVSNRTRNILIDRYHIDPAKIVTVYNGLIPKEHHDTLPWRKLMQEKLVTFLGRITFQKGPEYFMEAAKKVLDKHPDTHFVMAGSGDMMERMIQRAAELRISSRFHFTGFLKGDEVERMLAISDVFVMPSVSEPFGITPLEAVQADVPVIISRQSGVSEVLRNALKVDFWDTDALASAICEILENPGKFRTMAHSGKAELHNLTWDRAAEKVKEVYQSA